MPGSEGGPAKRTLRKEDTARRSDPYSLAWMLGYRRLATRYDRHAVTVLGLLQLACALICVRFLRRAEVEAPSRNP